MNHHTSPKIGIALGCGAALGWAHVGVLQTLLSHGIRPSVVTGCSIGSVVGAAYATDRLDDLTDWATSLTITEVVKFLDVGMHTLTGYGLLRGEKLMDFFEAQGGDVAIESLAMPLGIMATDLSTGESVKLTNGSLLQACRSSISVPGLFAPHYYQNRWLSDGGLLDPVPVALCRELGADIVIAVDVNADIRKSWEYASKDNALVRMLEGNRLQLDTPWLNKAFNWVKEKKKDKARLPGFYDTLHLSISIMQGEITRQRFDESKPEIIIRPDVHDFFYHDFYKADALITRGNEAAETQLEAIKAQTR